MSDTEPTARDWRDTVFLPKTDFPMKAGLAAKEPAILQRWEQEDVYGQLRRARAGRQRFLLHDGPPYANGDIHMGHAMNKILKDIIVRSATLRGFDAPYVPGWDCHGLPIEWKVEEAYRKKKQDKDQVPVDQFRAECRAYATEWVDVQREQFKRLGVMGEWDDPYLTMKYDSEAAIVAELLKFAESGQLYRGAKPVMWSPVEKTALAEAEVEYEDITSTQIDVAFEIVEAPNAPELVGAHAVIWTTTPWTIPVNQALAYGPDVEYWAFDAWKTELIPVTERGSPDTPTNRWQGRVLVAKDLIPSVLARARLQAKDDAPVWKGKGSELAGAVARHPMAHLFSSPLVGEDRGGGPAASAADKTHAAADAAGPHPNPSPQGGGALAEFFLRPRPFLPGDFVTTDAGTGLVHMAPDHGEDDFLLCKAHGIDTVFAVGDDGRYREDWPWLGGNPLSVINKKLNAPDGPICTDLRDAGALLSASDDYQHSYPHSWRSKAKVIFRATPQWFIPMDRTSVTPAKAEVSASSGAGVKMPAFAGMMAEAGEGLANSNHPTLRDLALDAIDRTRWVPEKAKNRIQAMVEGRPDWVISRQRAWGVPIALYLDKRTGDYLRDPAVNARIVAAFREGGADAWFTADHQALLGDAYDLADYEPQKDILDVWFDSGSTHAYVIEQRYGAGVRADLYVEGSDQHRGWFQSSLLESAGTRGRAPYDAVLTHGFALDQTGRKMSKSIGNVVDPLKIIGESGADILRLWVASTDYFEDVRIGKEVLAGTSDTYRKLRNTFRYLLGALGDFEEAERVAPTDMPELERWVLHRLAELDAELRAAAENFEFNRYTRLITGFANDDLSAFFFDIRKDSLYCDAPSALKRRAYRTVLDVVFHALVRWSAPILCFTAEEVWASRYPDGGSVHLLEWPKVDSAWFDPALGGKWADARVIRRGVTEAIEPLRREKKIGSSLEADVLVPIASGGSFEKHLREIDLTEVSIVSRLQLGQVDTVDRLVGDITVQRISFGKCGRCWRHLPEVETDGDLCDRCTEVVNG